MAKYVTTPQSNSKQINEVLKKEFIYGYHNYFLLVFLNDFIHVDTFVKDNGDCRLQGWYKPSVSLTLPECQIGEFDSEFGIFIKVLNVKPVKREIVGKDIDTLDW